MVWKLKSDKTGKEYTFADDVDQTLALQYMDDVEKPAAWSDVMGQVVPEVKRGAATMAAGIRQGLEDVGLAEPGQASAVMKEIAAERKAEMPENMSLTQQGVLGGLASLPEMGLSMLPGIGVASKAMTAKRALGIGLAVPTAAETAREYAEQREGGSAPGKALLHAGVSGGAEYIGERIPLKFAFEKFGEAGFKRAVAEFIGRDLVGEELTNAIQVANRKMSIQPDLTLQDFLESTYTTAVGSVVGSGTMGTAVKTLDVAGKKLGEYGQRKAVDHLFKQLTTAITDVDAGGKPVPTTDAETTVRSGKSYEDAVEAFRRAEISKDLWSDIATAYLPKVQAPTVAANATPEEVKAAFLAAVDASPKQVADFVAANLPTLAAANMDVRQTIADMVTSGKIAEEKGTQLIDAATAGAQRVVSALNTQAETLRKRNVEQEATHIARWQAFPEADKSELGQLLRALEAVQSQQAANGGIGYSADVLEQYGIDQQLAADLSTLPSDQQVSKIASAASFVRGLLFGESPVPGTRAVTSGASGGQYADFARWLSTGGNGTFGGKLYTTPVDASYGPNAGTHSSRQGWSAVAKPGDIDVFDTSSATGGQKLSPKMVKRLHAIVRQWSEKYLPNAAIAIHVDTVALHKSNTLGTHFFLGRDPTTGATKHQLSIDASVPYENMLMTLSHEFGHAMFTHYYANAKPEMREALRRQWVRDTFIDNWNSSLTKVMETRRADASKSLTSSFTMRQMVLAQLAGRAGRSSIDALDYWTNFMEWHAHTMERMLISDYRGMMEPVRKFMRQAFLRLQKFFKAEHRLWKPSQDMAEWLRLMSEQARVSQLQTMVGESLSAAMGQGLYGVTIPNAQQINLGGIIPNNPGGLSSPSVAPPGLANMSPAETPDFADSIKKMTAVFKKASPEHGVEVAKSVVRFNEFWSKLLGSFQVLELNKNVPGATRFLNALRAKFGYKSSWLRAANQTANDWEALGKEQAGAVAKLLLAEAESDTWYSDKVEDPNNPGHYVFVLHPTRVTEFKISDAGAEIYSKVRNMFMRALDAMEQLGLERVQRQFADDPANPQLAQQLAELRASYANMREKPYTPFSRFGKFYVKIKARDNGLFRDPITGTSKFYLEGQTVYFETFETAAERDRALPELQKRYGKSPMLDAQFNTGKIHDIVYSMRNLPPEFARAIAERLDLTQEQLREYNDLLKDLASDSSFVKHMKRKANISGYSPDTLRGFADYFLRFSNNFAKGKSAPEFEAAMREVRDYKRQMETTQLDTTKLDEFYNWMQRTFNYVMNPGNELAEFKSFVTAWYLGFNLPTAAQNITQLPFWTFPYLSKRFGVPKTLAVMKTALTDVLRSWKTMDALSKDEQAAMTYALEQGFIDESFATSIAQFAEGTALSRLTATATRHRLLNWYNHKALYMFQKAEEVNRRTSLLAAYRLNRSKDFTGEFDMAAFMKAREAVEVTQNEYALENRPEFMRGNKSVIFQFMHYVQNAIFRMTPWGDDAWKRLLLMQLSVAGLLGMPFAEDLLNAAKFLARKFGMHFEPELELRQLLTELNVNPEWVLRGAASHLGPFDLSYRYSLGRVIPGMEALGSNQRFNDAILDAVGDMGGAGATIGLNALKAIASLEDPKALKTLQYVAPSFVKYGLQAVDATNEGGVVARNGAMLAPLDSKEILGMSIGLQPRSKSVAYTRIGFETEVRNYWHTRRAMVLTNMYEALRTEDREAIADARKRLVEYNTEVMEIEPAMTINYRTLQKSMRQRFRAAALQTLTGSPYKNPTLTGDIEEAVPLE